MSDSAHEAQDDDGLQEGLLDLTLEGLFPANQTLMVNPAKRTVILLSHTPGRKPEIVAQHQFFPQWHTRPGATAPGLSSLLPL